MSYSKTLALMEYIPDYISEILNEVKENKYLTYVSARFGGNTIEIHHNSKITYSYLSCPHSTISRPPNGLFDGGFTSYTITANDFLDGYQTFIDEEEIKKSDSDEKDDNSDHNEKIDIRKHLEEEKVKYPFFHDTWAYNLELYYDIFQDTDKEKQVVIILDYLMEKVIDTKTHI